MKTMMTFFALMLGVTLSACSDNYDYIEEPAETTQVTDTIQADEEIRECLWMYEPHDEDVTNQKIDITIRVLEACLEVDDLKDCQDLQWFLEDCEECVMEIYALMAYVDGVRDYNKDVFSETVEETAIFQTYLDEVLNLTWTQYYKKYYQQK